MSEEFLLRSDKKEVLIQKVLDLQAQLEERDKEIERLKKTKKFEINYFDDQFRFTEFGYDKNGFTQVIEYHLFWNWEDLYNYIKNRMDKLKGAEL
jgi:hypothetical protein